MKLRTLKELLALTPPEVEFIVEPQLLAYSGSMFIYGEAESLKSWLALELVMAVSTGKPWLKYKTHQMKAALLQTEQTELMYRKRVVSFTNSMNGTAPLEQLYIASEPGFRLDDPIGYGTVREAIKIAKPQMVVLDNLFMSVQSLSDEIGIKRFLKGMSQLQANGVAVVVVTHPRKGGVEDEGIEEMAGMSDLNRWADTIIKVTVTGRTPGGRPEKVRLTFQKIKNAEEDVIPLNLIFNRDTTRMRIEEVQVGGY